MPTGPRCKKARAETDRHLAALEKLVNTDRGRTLLAEIKPRLIEYRAFTDSVIELAMANRIEAATQVLFGERYQTQVVYLDVLQQMIEFLSEQMATAAITAHTSADDAVRLMIAAAVLAGLLGVAFAWLITRSITRPLDHAVDAANRDVTPKQLAKALSVSVPYLTITLDRLEERGLLSRSRSEVDRRSAHVRLTRKGSDLVKKAEGIAMTMEAELLSHLTPGERALLFELLERVGAHRHV